MKTFDELRASYPALIPPRLSFECGEGWAGILARYLEDVSALLPVGAEFSLTRVQARYGTLTIDYEVAGVSNEIEDRLERATMVADARSVRCCDECGGKGEAREGAWTAAACDQHARSKAEAAEVAVFTIRKVRYVYDDDVDDLVPLTPERAKRIPWWEESVD